MRYSTSKLNTTIFTVGVGTVIVVYIGVAYTRKAGGGGVDELHSCPSPQFLCICVEQNPFATSFLDVKIITFFLEILQPPINCVVPQLVLPLITFSMSLQSPSNTCFTPLPKVLLEDYAGHAGSQSTTPK